MIPAPGVGIRYTLVGRDGKFDLQHVAAGKIVYTDLPGVLGEREVKYGHLTNGPESWKWRYGTLLLLFSVIFYFVFILLYCIF